MYIELIQSTSYLSHLPLTPRENWNESGGAHCTVGFNRGSGASLVRKGRNAGMGMFALHATVVREPLATPVVLEMAGL